MAVSRFGYAGVVRVEDNALNMAAAMDPVFVQEHGGIASAVTLILNEAGFPVPLGMASGRWLGTPRLTRKSDRTAAHRVLLVGDAAAYSEPFTGEGMSWALADATSVGAYVEQGIDEWAPGIERGWMSVHRRSIDRERTLSRLASSVLRSRPAVTFGLRVCRRFPVLAGPAVRFACDREYARL